MLRQFFPFQVGHRFLFVVFRAFNGLGEGFSATRDNRLHPLRRCSKCRRTFNGIDYGDSAARPGTDIKNVSARTDVFGGEIDEFGDLRNYSGDGLRDQCVFRIDDFQNSLRRKEIDVD